MPAGKRAENNTAATAATHTGLYRRKTGWRAKATRVRPSAPLTGWLGRGRLATGDRFPAARWRVCDICASYRELPYQTKTCRAPPNRPTPVGLGELIPQAEAVLRSHIR